MAMPEIHQALAGEDFTVFAYCNDGAVRLLDAKPLIKIGGVFAKLADPDFFRDRLTIMNGTVAWDVAGNRDATACIDIDPETIFETAPVVKDPLSDAG